MYYYGTGRLDNFNVILEVRHYLGILIHLAIACITIKHSSYSCIIMMAENVWNSCISCEISMFCDREFSN